MLYDVGPLLAFPPIEYLVYGFEKKIIQPVGCLAIQVGEIQRIHVDPDVVEVAVAVHGYDNDRNNSNEPQGDEQPLSETCKHG
jgi:hypothetical protein